MVFFTCDNCGESLKKAQVSKHFGQCRSHSFSCMDCQRTFDRKTYADHLKCITENMKYGGKDYVEKEFKGEARQNAWTECVQKAIDNVKEKNLRDLLINIKGFSNIPRKEPKFINFLVNSCKVRDRKLCQRAWTVIDEQVQRLQANEKPLNGISKVPKKDEKMKESVEDGLPTGNGIQANGKEDEQNTSTAEFKWKKTIKRKLKSSEGTMKLKRLRKEVIQEYCEKSSIEVNEEALKKLFQQKLESAGVVVDGNIVKMENLES